MAGLVLPKAYYVCRADPPGLSLGGSASFLRQLAACSHADVAFAAALGLAFAGALRLFPRRAVFAAGAAAFAAAIAFAVANLEIIARLRTPLTYALIYLAGDPRLLRSSVAPFFTARVLAALLGAPALFLALAALTARRAAPRRSVLAAAAGALAVFCAYGAAVVRESGWREPEDRRIADSPHFTLLASIAAEIAGRPAVLLPPDFPPEDARDFEPPAAAAPDSRAPAGPRPRNVIVLVMESTPAFYSSAYGSPYDATPNLAAEAAHALVFDAAYCHVGRTTNSLVAIALSTIPPITWKDLTQEYPHLAGASLAEPLAARGFRTAFMTSGDLEWGDERRFLAGRGFAEVLDHRDLAGGNMLSSWGGEDRWLVDGMIRWLDRDRARPFCLVAWTDQTHQPYEPSPGQEEINFFRGRPPPGDEWSLGRYLNVLHETDRHLGRLFAALRERGLADDTLVVVTGDHGEAFGFPHDVYMHGFALYEENVRVPLLLWNPRLFAGGARSGTIVSHVDLAPTVLDLLGVAAPPGWQGRSAFAADRPPRAYFYAGKGEFLLGVREERWKYNRRRERGARDALRSRRGPDGAARPGVRRPRAVPAAPAAARCVGGLRAAAARRDRGPAAVARACSQPFRQVASGHHVGAHGCAALQLVSRPEGRLTKSGGRLTLGR